MTKKKTSRAGPGRTVRKARTIDMKTPTAFRLSADLLERLDRNAAKQGVSRTWLVEVALRVSFGMATTAAERALVAPEEPKFAFPLVPSTERPAVSLLG